MNLELSRSGHPVRRRPTPIPVAPPRVPTPMPSNNNNAPPGSNTKDFNIPPSTAFQSTSRTQHSPLQHDPPSRIATSRSHKTPSHRLDNEDVRTGWINPRLISKIDLDLIRRSEYIPPSERNMNSSTGVHQVQPQAHLHLHQQHHYQRQQGCGRQHDRDWEGAGTATPPTGLQRPRSVAPRSVAGASPTVSDVRPRRPSHKHPDHAVAVTTTRVMERPTAPVSRALVSTTSKCPVPVPNKWPATIKTMEKVPLFPGKQKPKQSRKNTNQERPKNLVGFHHHQSATTACYLGSMTDGSSESGGVYGVYSETKYVYAVNKVPAGNPIQASAAAAFFARAAQKLNLSSSPSHRKKRYNSEDGDATGFCGALQRSPPPVPPALLRRIGVKEVTGVGKVKVMLRVCTPTSPPPGGGGGASPDHSPASNNSFFSLDKRKKQVTLTDPTTGSGGGAPEDRRVGVAAPKMFAFDAVFSQDDSQTEVCSSALTDVIHAVINGNDGCLFCFGHAGLGKSYTMMGSPDNANSLGIIPCAISWLFKGINEQKQKTGARFSVRVSAVEICGPTNQLRDLLSGYSNDCEQSPGAYLRTGSGSGSGDDTLFGGPAHCELRVPTAEKAAHYLDAAVEGRRPVASSGPHHDYGDSHLLFTLHVYQYSVAGKGGVCGGRSRLHLLDLGNSDRGRNSGGIPLSGVGNVLLAIFNGQKHLPYKEHKLTQLLRECLGSLTCHAAMIVHVSPMARNYMDTLTTVQLASRIHRMRRRRIKFVSAAVGNGSGGSSGEEAARPGAAGTSSEPDPSSSDLSADTVIYVGPAADDATDGEHPPVYIPSLNSGDNRCSMSKALRGSIAEHRPSPTQTTPKSTQKAFGTPPDDKAPPTTPHRTPTKVAQSGSGGGSVKTSPAHAASPKSSPSRIPCATKGKAEKQHGTPTSGVNGGSDEQWIDGPRISKSKVAEARHLMKEACHVKKCETWIDGPMQGDCSAGYGYMDSHKKNMIRKWVEHQAIQLQKSKYTYPKDNKSAKEPPKELTQFKSSEDDEVLRPISLRKQDIVEESVIRTGLKTPNMPSDTIPECHTPDERDDKPGKALEAEDDEDEPEMPPALPLIQPLSSREVSLESLDILLKERMLSNAEYNSYHNAGSYDEHHHVDCSEDGDDILEIIEVEEPLEPVPTQDSCLQVTEEDIALCMGYAENPLPEVDQENPLDHPLRILSQENLTVVSTFTDSMSVFTDLERILPRHRFERYHMHNDDYEDPDNPYPQNGNVDDMTRKKFDQLARLHELYTNRLAKANVANSETYQRQQRSNGQREEQQHHRRPLTRCESLTLTDMLYGGGGGGGGLPDHDNSSICSEPAYVQQKFCENCKVNMMARPATVQNWYTDPFLSASTQDLTDHPPEYGSAHSGRFQSYSAHHSKYSGEALAFLRHPDGASNPNLREETARRLSASIGSEKKTLPGAGPNMAGATTTDMVTSQPGTERANRAALSLETSVVTAVKAGHKSEGYDSGHDSTPRTSKHSPAAMSRRAESGYDSVVRDSESSSVDSEPTRRLHQQQQQQQRTRGRSSCKHRHDKSFCSWFLNPFTCKYVDEPPETHF